jgi:hypothetical protein
MDDALEGPTTRLVLDLRVDADGRPFGSVRLGERPDDEPFRDWLDLLRLLEARIGTSPRTDASTGGP